MPLQAIISLLFVQGGGSKKDNMCIRDRKGQYAAGQSEGKMCVEDAEKTTATWVLREHSSQIDR